MHAGLYFFGRDVGRLFGGKRLLALYVVGGVAGSLAHCGWYYYQACKHNQGRFGRSNFFRYAPPALGASAAVNAVMVSLVQALFRWPDDRHVLLRSKK